MRLTILGSGDAFGNGGRRQSAYLFQAPGTTFLVEAGPTVLGAMKDAGIPPNDVDFILVSHLHGDHFAGIPFFLLQCCYETPRERELVIAGPEGTEQRVHDLFRAMYLEASRRPFPFRVRFVELEPGVAEEIHGVRVVPLAVPHQEEEPSLAFRLEVAGRGILYSGDSPWVEEFIEWSRGADLFLCECTFWECDAPIHVRYPDIDGNLSRIAARRTVLTHLGSEVLARLDEVRAETATDGMVIEL